MTTKRVEVGSADSRLFVKALLELGSQGAILPDDAGVYKSVTIRCQLEIDEDVKVKESAIVRVLPQEKKKKVEAPKQEVKAPVIELAIPTEDSTKEEAIDSTQVEVKQAEIKPVTVYNREQLEAMNMKELRDATNGTGRSKQELIDEYFGIKK